MTELSPTARRCAGVGDLLWEANQRLLRLTPAGHADPALSVRRLLLGA